MWPEFGAAVKLVWFAGAKKLSYRVQWRKLEKLKQRIDSMKRTSPRADGGHDPRTPDLGHLLLTLLLQEHGSLEEDWWETRWEQTQKPHHNTTQPKRRKIQPSVLARFTHSFFFIPVKMIPIQDFMQRFVSSLLIRYGSHVLLYFIRTAAWSQMGW